MPQGEEEATVGVPGLVGWQVLVVLTVLESRSGSAWSRSAGAFSLW